MADETEPASAEPGDNANAEPDSGTTVAEQTAPAEEAAVDEGAEEEKKEEKLHQTVEIKDIGPCKKHIKVTVERSDIDKRFDEKIKELVSDAQVPGFRPGKAPRKVIVRRFHKDVSDQIKGQILLASLEQLAEDNDIAPLSPPNINPASIVIPEDGPFVYEFDVEVRPDFDVPNYKGLKIKRPVKTFTDADVDKEQHKILSRFGKIVPKPEGKVEIGDSVVADMTTRFNNQVIGTAKEIMLRVDDTLAFKDGVAEKFGAQLAGAKAGDTRTVDITLSDAVGAPQLRGQKVEATLEIKELKTTEPPELTHEFLHNFGVHTPEQLTEKVRGLLESRLEYQQRQAARDQVLAQISASATWELPPELLTRQARKALARRVMEMREAGMSEQEIAGRQRLLQQDVLQTTAASLKEHFVLQKIAETEKIDVDDDEIDSEIEYLADQSNQSPRRVRAQLEKDDLIETLAVQVIERKTLDLILESAEYEDVALEHEATVATAEEQAVPGEMRDPTAPPPEAEEGTKAEAEKSTEETKE
jgi:trigger factor